MCDFILHVNGKMTQTKNENENELLHLSEQEKKYLARNISYYKILKRWLKLLSIKQYKIYLTG